MEQKYIKSLQNKAVREFIAINLDKSPEKLALSSYPAGLPPIPMHVIATQVKLLQRAQRKLWPWAAKQCIFTPKTYEQSSSHATAIMKASMYAGKRILDLTLGLGEDARAFSHRFERVTALELDPGHAEIAACNFELLGRSNVEIHNQSAESFVAAYNGPPFDLVYADPARRDGGQRRFLLQDCSPDLTSLLPALQKIARQILVKVSPLFDLQEGLRLLPDVSRVMVFSIGNECKEVLFEITPGFAGEPELVVKFQRRTGRYAWRLEDFRMPWHAVSEIQAPMQSGLPTSGFVYEADTALFKADAAAAYFAHRFPGGAGWMNHPGGYYFSAQRLDFIGNSYEIIEVLPFKSKIILSALKKNHITKVQLSRRNFDLPIAEVRKKLKIKEGGANDFLLFTRDGDGGRWAILCRKL